MSVVISLSPGIPLIPLMLAANSSIELMSITISFASATIVTVVILTYISYKAFRPPEIFHGREDVIAGLIIAAVGAITHIIEIKPKRVTQ
ncbi:hypothetical protein Asulf_02244 [Archaeoglobus sulfaticallidus PM70-1]|uniref:Uncharacterized protein n=1 Tax=Archaeoglobus sulfaticallidus PM70-1 TaxID=387631 RepID=N0BIP4_9EURY|nr:hypothetical protein [Archaeoglobus sulfaticallidus]AGK62197.1 hypothetical protein Asulf_02244 [Archaeoglobus sulfaticallidus PM70-1]